MNTLLKFTHGIELLIAALLLAFVIIYFIYWLGERQYRKDYEKAYKYLKFLVEHSVVNAPAKKAIKEKFDEISKYSCKNYEKLQVLEKTFDDKFKEKLPRGILRNSRGILVIDPRTILNF